MKTTFSATKKTSMIPIMPNVANVAKNECGLLQHFFDPIKGSPPNNFMNKLEMRMSIYNSSYKDKCRDNFVIE
jgi:hypothetical protein